MNEPTELSAWRTVKLERREWDAVFAGLAALRIKALIHRDDRMVARVSETYNKLAAQTGLREPWMKVS